MAKGLNNFHPCGVGKGKQLKNAKALNVPNSSVQSTPLFVCISIICYKFSYTCEKYSDPRVSYIVLERL